MKTCLFWLLTSCLMVSLQSSAQSFSPTVIPAAGGVSKGNGLQLEWTLGETAVETHTTTREKYTQGFHQPLLVFTSHRQLSKPQKPFRNTEALQVIVAPNPVGSLLKVFIQSEANTPVSITLFDMHGRTLQSKKLNASLSTEFNVEGYAAGMYVLHITNGEGILLHSYKVLKTN